MLGNVLVIEDDPDCGHLFVAILKDAGYAARLVRSRDDAADALTHNLYDYIVVDLFMSGMTIDEFLKLPAAKRSNTVIVSAIADPQKVAKRLGVHGWLRKPFDHEQLFEAMHASACYN